MSPAISSVLVLHPRWYDRGGRGGLSMLDRAQLQQESTLGQRERRLPLPRTTFVGRDRQLSEVGRLLKRNRLVTLTGPGGTGKTRVAIEAASAAADRHPDGVFFVDLAPVSDEGLVMSTI